MRQIRLRQLDRRGVQRAGLRCGRAPPHVQENLEDYKTLRNIFGSPGVYLRRADDRALSCQKLHISPSTIFEEDRISMRIYRKAILLAVTLVPAGLWAQVSTTAAPSVLHIL